MVCCVACFLSNCVFERSNTFDLFFFFKEEGRISGFCQIVSFYWVAAFAIIGVTLPGFFLYLLVI